MRGGPSQLGSPQALAASLGRREGRPWSARTETISASCSATTQAASPGEAAKDPRPDGKRPIMQLTSRADQVGLPIFIELAGSLASIPQPFLSGLTSRYEAHGTVRQSSCSCSRTSALVLANGAFFCSHSAATGARPGSWRPPAPASVACRTRLGRVYPGGTAVRDTELRLVRLASRFPGRSPERV